MNQVSLNELRETKYVSSKMDSVRLDGTFTGYASVYNEIDLGNDIVLPGAFKNSLRTRGPKNIRMLFQHNPDEPIGVWEEIVETSKGLKVRGRITAGVERGKEVLKLMRAGALDGLSIGFKTVRSQKDKIQKTRNIIEADLWEISIVTFPMQENARINSVKNLIPTNKNKFAKYPTIREFERWLVRDAGLSRKDAHLVITKGYRHAKNQREAVLGPSGLAEHIRSAAQIFDLN